MRVLFLKNMICVSIVSLTLSGGTLAKSVNDNSQDKGPSVVLTKDTTAKVEKRMLWLVDVPEEYNPPDGNPNFPQMMSEADMPDEPTHINLDDKPVSIPQEPEAEVDSHINEIADPGATPVNFTTNTPILKGNPVRALNVSPVSFSGNPVIIKPMNISSEDEESKLLPDEEAAPTPQKIDPYDPTNEGESKGGRHKGQHYHQSKHYQQSQTGVHMIPIIKMGDGYEERTSGLTVVKPWNS